MASFGFSINSLTLCGLVLAIGLVVDDAIIVVENVEKFLHRGYKPMEATRAAMAEITTPIVTITLVLAAVFVPVAFMPGHDRAALQPVRHDDRLLVRLLGDQLADPQPGDVAAVPQGQDTRRVQVLPLPLVQRRAATGSRTPTTRSSNSRRITGGRSSSRRSLLLALTGWMIMERPKAFIPTEDQGYLIVVVQTPDGTSREVTAKVVKRVEAIAQKLDGVQHIVTLDGMNVMNSTNQTQLPASSSCRSSPGRNAGRPNCGPTPWPRSSRECSSAQIHDALALVMQPPPIRGLSQTGGLSSCIEDRSAKGRRGPPVGRRPVPGRGPQAPRADGHLHDVLGPRPAASVRARPHQGPTPRRPGLRRLRHAPGQPGRLLHQRLRPLRQGLEGDDPGRGRASAPRPRTSRRCTS